MLDIPALEPLAAAAVASIAAACSDALCPDTARAAAAHSCAAQRAQVAAWQRAATTLAAASPLGGTAAGQRALVAAGLDSTLVQALLSAPAQRGPADDAAPLSAGTAAALGLLRTRMRWPGSAALLASLGQAVSLELPTSALLACLRQLHRGAARSTPLAALRALEDEGLALACLVEPWLGDVASETVLCSILGLERPFALVPAALCGALGLPPTSKLPLGFRCGYSEAIDTGADAALEPPPHAVAALPYAGALWWAADVDTRALAAARSSVRRLTACDDAAPAASDAASNVADVIHQDPGMRDVCAWWRNAAAALTRDVAAPQQRSRLRAHDITLLLQRVVMVAMPRLRDGLAEAQPPLARLTAAASASPATPHPGASRPPQSLADAAWEAALSLDDMRQIAGDAQPPWPGIAVPAVSLVDPAAAAPWMSRVKALRRVLGEAHGAADGGGSAPGDGLAALQHVCALALMRGSAVGGPAPGGDWLVTLVHALLGATDRACTFLTALALSPAAAYVWPLLGSQVRPPVAVASRRLR